MRRHLLRAAALLLAAALVPLPASAAAPAVPASAAVTAPAVPASAAVPAAAFDPAPRSATLGGTPAAAARGAVVAKYQTNAAAYLYATAHSRARVATLPADYTHATRTNRALNGRIHVQYGSASGWIAAAKVSRVSIGTAVGKLTWRQSAAKNVGRWCRGVPVAAGRGLGNFASMSGSPGRWTEAITLDTGAPWGGSLDPNHPLAIAIQYHECAHILQYRAYDYRPATLDGRMNRVYGRSNGAEFMADCMAVAMGARLSGAAPNGGTWRAGYGGKCTTAHLAAARQVIAGRAV